jgi:hypothetical protein
VLFWKARASLPNITSVDISIASIQDREPSTFFDIYSILDILPSIETADLSNIQIARTDYSTVFDLIWRCPNLSSLQWSACNIIGLVGVQTRGSLAPLLRDINLDEAVMPVNWLQQGMQATYETVSFAFGHPDGNNTRQPHLMMLSSTELQRLSIKNTFWVLPNGEVEPVSQEMIIRLVRRIPSLRWLRSDLNPDNVAMLQQQHPHVVFTDA